LAFIKAQLLRPRLQGINIKRVVGFMTYDEWRFKLRFSEQPVCRKACEPQR
jgi:hypothetical protein